QLEPEDAVHLLALGGQHHDRQGGGARVLAEAPADLEPVHLRKHQVEENEIGQAQLDLAKRVGARPGLADMESLPLEMKREQVAEVRLVPDDQHATRHGGCGGAAGWAGRACLDPLAAPGAAAGAPRSARQSFSILLAAPGAAAGRPRSARQSFSILLAAPGAAAGRPRSARQSFSILLAAPGAAAGRPRSARQSFSILLAAPGAAAGRPRSAR